MLVFPGLRYPSLPRAKTQAWEVGEYIRLFPSAQGALRTHDLGGSCANPLQVDKQMRPFKGSFQSHKAKSPPAQEEPIWTRKELRPGPASLLTTPGPVWGRLEVNWQKKKAAILGGFFSK